mmetsp:Transcript_58800/g.164172  ORF Transcript_58800/g.164172 Transcript_58800/m.164172 type:complete len:214 (+) Transcript_58800:80-721(+)
MPIDYSKFDSVKVSDDEDDETPVGVRIGADDVALRDEGRAEPEPKNDRPSTAEAPQEPEEPEEAVFDFVMAARAGDLEDVQAAIAAGVGVNAPGQGGATALLMASANGHLDVAKALLEARADPLANNEAKNCPLHWSALNAQPEICRVLLAARADANTKNEFGRKPFDEAFGRNHAEICEIIAPFTDFSEELPPEAGTDSVEDAGAANAEDAD